MVLFIAKRFIGYYYFHDESMAVLVFI